MENLARYIIRVSFSQERMSYVPEKAINHSFLNMNEQQVSNTLV